MKKIKFIVLITLISIILVSCSVDVKKDGLDNNEVEKSETLDNDSANTTLDDDMKEDDFDDLYVLLEETGEVEDKDLNNEYELVDIASSWVIKLEEMELTNEDINTYTIKWLEKEKEEIVLRFKEVFPKLNDYALGLIKKDPKTIELYEKSDDDKLEFIEDLSLPESRWTEVFNTINSAIE